MLLPRFCPYTTPLAVGIYLQRQLAHFRTLHVVFEADRLGASKINGPAFQYCGITIAVSVTARRFHIRVIGALTGRCRTGIRGGCRAGLAQPIVAARVLPVAKARFEVCVDSGMRIASNKAVQKC